MGQSGETLPRLCLSPCTAVMRSSFLVLAVVIALTGSAPQRFRLPGRSQGGSTNTNTKFFTGNQAIDSAAAGAALGLATQYIGNQIFNPCRNRYGNRHSNRTRTQTQTRASSETTPSATGSSGSLAVMSAGNSSTTSREILVDAKFMSKLILGFQLPRLCSHQWTKVAEQMT